MNGLLFSAQVDAGINCFCGSADDEASKPLHSFDKNLFDLCKVPADQIAVSGACVACWNLLDNHYIMAKLLIVEYSLIVS